MIKISSKNFLLILAAIALVGLGTMAYVVYRQDLSVTSRDKTTLTLSQQSTSTETESIEKDLEDTDLGSLDQELSEIEQELSM